MLVLSVPTLLSETGSNDSLHCNKHASIMTENSKDLQTYMLCILQKLVKSKNFTE